MADKREPKQTKDSKKPKPEKKGRELTEKELDKTSGGLMPIRRES
jgi:bacteriocin-like protein